MPPFGSGRRRFAKYHRDIIIAKSKQIIEHIKIKVILVPDRRLPEIHKYIIGKSYLVRQTGRVKILCRVMGIIIGMGISMGKIELDDRGRLTIPASIREKLNLKAGDKLTIEIGQEKTIRLRKSATKSEIFQHLVGCITIPQEKSPTIQEIKSISS